MKRYKTKTTGPDRQTLRSYKRKRGVENKKQKQKTEKTQRKRTRCYLVYAAVLITEETAIPTRVNLQRDVSVLWLMK